MNHSDIVWQVVPEDELTGNNGTVAAVVAAAAKNEYATFVATFEAFSHSVGAGGAGSLHELEGTQAAALHRESLALTNRGNLIYTVATHVDCLVGELVVCSGKDTQIIDMRGK